MNALERAYESGHFNVSRRAFMQIALASGVTAAGGMLVFPDEASALFTEPDAPHWDALEGAKVRFTVHSDTHFNGCDVESKFPAAFEAIYRHVPDVKTHVFVGDSTNNGKDEEYAALLANINDHLQAPPLIVMGNHEMYAYGRNLDGAVAAFKSKLLNKITVPNTPQAPGGELAGCEHVHYVVGGYHLIGCSCGLDYDYGAKAPRGASDGLAPVKWMIREIEKAVDEDPKKPVFLFTHHPMPETMHCSKKDFSAGWIGTFTDGDQFVEQFDFQNYLKAHFPQVIHFSGHTHIPENDPRSIHQDGFTAVQTATFGNNFWMDGGGYDEDGGTGGHPGAGYDASQCLLVEVDPAKDNEVTIRRMDFREGAYIGAPWVFSVSDEGTWAYNLQDRERRSNPPVVDGDAAVSVSVSEQDDAKLLFNVPADKIHADADAIADDVVLGYRVVLHEAQNPQGEAVYDATYMSDYYKAQVNRPAVFTREFFGAGLKPGAEYLMDVYAKNAWGKEAKVGNQTRFTVPERVVAERELLLGVEVDAKGLEDASGKAHVATTFGSDISVTVDPAFGRRVAGFDGTNALGFDVEADEFKALGMALTSEVLVKLDAAPASGYWDVFSCGEGTGQWLEYYPDKTLRFYHSDGRSYVAATVEPGEWTHIVHTYDGSEMKIYQNGAMVGSRKMTNPISAPSASKLRWFVGGDMDGEGNPQAKMRGSIAFARLFSGRPMNEEEVAAAAEAASAYAMQFPSAEELGSPRAGETYELPVVQASREGSVIEAVPQLTDPNGSAVELLRLEEDAETAAPDSPKRYAFIPSCAGTYTLSYVAGYSIVTGELPVAEGRPEPGPVEPEVPDGNQGNGGDQDSNNGNQGNAGVDGPAQNDGPGAHVSGGRPATQGGAAKLPQMGDGGSIAAMIAGLGGLAAASAMALGAADAGDDLPQAE